MELSPRARQRHTLLAGIYVGSKKPHIGLFLDSIMDELQELQNVGFTWCPDTINNAQVQSRFLTVVLAADSDARYAVMRLTRFNGYYGCTMCEAVGIRIIRTQVYPWNEIEIERTNENIRNPMERVAETGITERGIKVVSPFYALPDFDLRKGQIADALHCLWKNNVGRLFKLWTSSEYRHERYHIGPHTLNAINGCVLAIKTPHKLSRLARTIADFNQFTASEARNLALFYWLPCAGKFMDEDVIRHFALFADASYTLCQESISLEELARAEQQLHTYYQEFSTLYDEQNTVYNVHLLRHICDSVRDWGPLWVASAFLFESINKKIIGFLTSPTERASQVVDRFTLPQFLETALDYPHLSQPIRDKLKSIIG